MCAYVHANTPTNVCTHVSILYTYVFHTRIRAPILRGVRIFFHSSLFCNHIVIEMS